MTVNIHGIPVNTEFGEVTERYRKVWDSGDHMIGGWRASWTRTGKRGGFYGATMEQMIGWLDNGYRSETFDISNIESLTQDRRRSTWDEDDGELFFDRVLNGDDQPFRRARKVKETKSGITINVMFSLNCGVDTDVIERYARFVLTTIAGIEANGHDTEIFITNPLDHLYTNRDAPRSITARFRVKRFGELSDFTAWSCLFSPGGFRHIVFCGLGLSAEKNGWTCGQGLGTPRGSSKGWDVSYEDGILSFDCPPGPYNFPEEEMMRKLKACGVVK